MSIPRPRSLCLLLNARAAADPAVRDAVVQIRQRGHRVAVRALWERGDAARYAGEANAAGCDAIVSCGGDGMLNEVVNAVASTQAKTAVTTMAYGTANDFANATGLAALRPIDILTLATEGTSRRIDLGKCNDRLFVNVASGGFGAEVTAETPRDLKDWLGGLAYTLTGLMKYLGDEDRELRVKSTGRKWSGLALGFTVANSRLAGGGYVVAPQARLDDGLLDLHVIPPVDIESLFVEDEFDDSTGATFAAKWFEVSSPRELVVNLDGEPMRGQTFRFTVLEKRLRFFLPASAFALLGPTGQDR